MIEEPVLVLFCGGMGGSAIEDAFAAALRECALDTLEEARGTGAYARYIVVADEASAAALRPRLFPDVVLDIDHENPGKQVYKLINPMITRAEGELVWEEGCLSVVDFTAEVRRAAQVEVVARDEHEKEVKIAAEGLLAVALQHEIDHLDGKLFIDRISRLKRELYTRRRKKMLRTGVEPPAESPRLMI